jgi:hypothetical protein
MLRVLVLMLASCAASRSPRVAIHLVDPPQWSAHDRRFVEAVGSVWSALGMEFAVTDDPRRSPDACARDWHRTGRTDCTIDVGLVKVDGYAARNGRAAHSTPGTGEVWLDAQWDGYALLRVVAHEVGHVLFAPGQHTSSGVMAQGTGEWRASPADLALACRNIGRGCS